MKVNSNKEAHHEKETREAEGKLGDSTEEQARLESRLTGLGSILKHRGRYPFRTYATLVLIVSLFAVVNTVFTNLLQKIVGNWDFGSVLILTLGLLFFAVLFAFLFWIADMSGTIGRLLGAKDEETS